MGATRLDLPLGQLAVARDVRDFLRIYFAAPDRVSGRPVSYAEFGRRAGFLSRSFPRDVATGKRRLTARTFPGFVRALGLNADWNKFFRLLAARDEPSLGKDGWDELTIAREIERLRPRLQTLRVRSRRDPRTLSSQILRYPEVPAVYAALGNAELGASEEEIAGKTGLTAGAVSRALVEMKRWNLVDTPAAGRWSAKSFHLALADQKDDVFFRNLFLSQVERARSSAALDFRSDRSLFFTSSLSVSTGDLPRLKKEMQELLLRFVDRSEFADGDRVINIVLGMT